MQTDIKRDKSEVLIKAFNKACEELNINTKDRAIMLGVNRATLSRNASKGFPIESKEGELQLNFIRIYRSLFAIAGGDKNFMQHWFSTENTALNGTPSSICLKIEGLFRTNQYLDAMRGKI